MVLNSNVSLIWTGIIVLVIGKVLKISILDTIGFLMIAIGGVTWALGIAGISLPFNLPF